MASEDGPMKRLPAPKGAAAHDEPTPVLRPDDAAFWELPQRCVSVDGLNDLPGLNLKRLQKRKKKKENRAKAAPATEST